MRPFMRHAMLLALVFSFAGLDLAAQDPVVRAAQEVDAGLIGLPLGAGVHSDGSRVAVVYLDSGALAVETVHVANSDDGGATFAAPVRVDHEDGALPKRVTRDSVRVSGDHVYVLWRDARNGSTIDDLYFNHSTDGGQTFQSADIRLDDGAGGLNEVFDWRFAVSPDPTGDDLYVLMTSEIVAGNGNEEVFLVVSLDGGQTWSNAIPIGGDDSSGVDVDQIALATEGSSVHMAWEDDGGSAATDSVLYQRTLDAGATLLPLPVALDPSDTLGIGDSASSSDTGLTLAVEGQLVFAAWPEERTDPFNEELRVNLSFDGGSTWGTDQRIGGYDPLTDDINGLSALVAGGVFAVAWEDNRDQAGFNRIYAAVSNDMGSTFTETQVSGALGGTVPRLVGAASNLVTLYTTESGALDRAAASFSLDGGMTWSSELALSDNTSSDSDSTDGAYAADLDNLQAVFLNDVSGSNAVFGAGFSLCTQGSSVVRNSGTNPQSLTADVPRLGATWTASVDLGLTGHGFAALLGYGSSANLTLGGGQVLLINLADPGGELLGLAVMGGNPAQFSSLIPNVPSFCGLPVSIQALHFGSATPFALSNAVDLVLTGI